MDIWILGYIATAWVIGWGFSYSLYKIESMRYGAEIGKFDFAWFIALWIPFLICWAFNKLAPSFFLYAKLFKKDKG